MTIDEAIKEEQTLYDIAKDKYEKLGIKNCLKRMEEHKQYIEWLEELKELRNMTAGHLYAVAFNIGYLKAEKEARNKAIDDCLLVINENRAKFRADICYSDLYDSIVQLKAGGGNGT